MQSRLLQRVACCGTPGTENQKVSKLLQNFHLKFSLVGMLSLPLTACSYARSEVGLDGESHSCHIFSVELREPVLLQRLSLRTTSSDRVITPSSIRIQRDRSTFLNTSLTGGESQHAFDSSLLYSDRQYRVNGEDPQCRTIELPCLCQRLELQFELDSVSVDPTVSAVRLDSSMDMHQLESLMVESAAQSIVPSEVQSVPPASHFQLELTGLRCDLVPSAHRLISLLNLSGHFASLSMLRDAAESDLLCGLALRQARSFIQSAEMFRRAQSYFIAAIKAGNSDVAESDGLEIGAWPTAVRLWLAKAELLVTESINQHTYIYDKMVAYREAAALYIGTVGVVSPVPTINRSADLSTSMRSLQEPLLKLLLRILLDRSDGREFVQSAALRGLEFLIDNVGCALGEHYSTILESLFDLSHFIDPPAVESENLKSLSAPNVALSSLSTGHAISPTLAAHFVRLFRAVLQLGAKFSPSILQFCVEKVLFPRMIQAATAPADHAFAGHFSIVEHQMQLLRSFVYFATLLGGELPVPLAWFSVFLGIDLSKHSDDSDLVQPSLAWKLMSREHEENIHALLSQAQLCCVNALQAHSNVFNPEQTVFSSVDFLRSFLGSILSSFASADGQVLIESLDISHEVDIIAEISAVWTQMHPRSNNLAPLSQVSDFLNALEVMQAILDSSISSLPVTAFIENNRKFILDNVTPNAFSTLEIARFFIQASLFGLLSACGHSIEAASTLNLWIPLHSCLASCSRLIDRLNFMCNSQDCIVSCNVHLAQILDRVSQGCQYSAPSAGTLGAIKSLIPFIQFHHADPIIAKALSDFLEAFLPWIPQSVFDSTFEVLESLLRLALCKPDVDVPPNSYSCWIPPHLVVNGALKVLLDRCTVHSKSYQFARKALIEFFVEFPFLNHADVYLDALFSFCLKTETMGTSILNAATVIGTHAPVPSEVEAMEEKLAFLFEYLQSVDSNSYASKWLAKAVCDLGLAGHHDQCISDILQELLIHPHQRIRTIVVKISNLLDLKLFGVWSAQEFDVATFEKSYGKYLVSRLTFLLASLQFEKHQLDVVFPSIKHFIDFYSFHMRFTVNVVGSNANVSFCSSKYVGWLNKQLIKFLDVCGSLLKAITGQSGDWVTLSSMLLNSHVWIAAQASNSNDRTQTLCTPMCTKNCKEFCSTAVATVHDSVINSATQLLDSKFQSWRLAGVQILLLINSKNPSPVPSLASDSAADISWIEWLRKSGVEANLSSSFPSVTQQLLHRTMLCESAANIRNAVSVFYETGSFKLDLSSYAALIPFPADLHDVSNSDGKQIPDFENIGIINPLDENEKGGPLELKLDFADIEAVDSKMPEKAVQISSSATSKLFFDEDLSDAELGIIELDEVDDDVFDHYRNPKSQQGRASSAAKHVTAVKVRPPSPRPQEDGDALVPGSLNESDAVDVDSPFDESKDISSFSNENVEEVRGNRYADDQSSDDDQQAISFSPGVDEDDSELIPIENLERFLQHSVDHPHQEFSHQQHLDEWDSDQEAPDVDSNNFQPDNPRSVRFGDVASPVGSAFDAEDAAEFSTSMKHLRVPSSRRPKSAKGRSRNLPLLVQIPQSSPPSASNLQSRSGPPSPPPVSPKPEEIDDMPSDSDDNVMSPQNTVIEIPSQQSEQIFGSETVKNPWAMRDRRPKSAKGRPRSPVHKLSPQALERSPLQSFDEQDEMQHSYSDDSGRSNLSQSDEVVAAHFESESFDDDDFADNVNQSPSFNPSSASMLQSVNTLKLATPTSLSASPQSHHSNLEIDEQFESNGQSDVDEEEQLYQYEQGDIESHQPYQDQESNEGSSDVDPSSQPAAGPHGLRRRRSDDSENTWPDSVSEWEIEPEEMLFCENDSMPMTPNGLPSPQLASNQNSSPTSSTSSRASASGLITADGRRVQHSDSAATALYRRPHGPLQIRDGRVVLNSVSSPLESEDGEPFEADLGESDDQQSDDEVLYSEDNGVDYGYDEANEIQAQQWQQQQHYNMQHESEAGMYSQGDNQQEYMDEQDYDEYYDQDRVYMPAEFIKDESHLSEQARVQLMNAQPLRKWQQPEQEWHPDYDFDGQSQGHDDSSEASPQFGYSQAYMDDGSEDVDVLDENEAAHWQTQHWSGEGEEQFDEDQYYDDPDQVESGAEQYEMSSDAPISDFDGDEEVENLDIDSDTVWSSYAGEPLHSDEFSSHSPDAVSNLTAPPATAWSSPVQSSPSFSSPSRGQATQKADSEWLGHQKQTPPSSSDAASQQIFSPLASPLFTNTSKSRTVTNALTAMALEELDQAPTRALTKNEVEQRKTTEVSDDIMHQLAEIRMAKHKQISTPPFSSVDTQASVRPVSSLSSAFSTFDADSEFLSPSHQVRRSVMTAFNAGMISSPAPALAAASETNLAAERSRLAQQRARLSSLLQKSRVQAASKFTDH